MRKEKDIQKLKEILKLLVEVFIKLDDIEDVEEIFNSDNEELEELKDFAERQQEVLRSIKREGFDAVIDNENGGITYEEWLEYELNNLLELVEDL